MYRPTTDPDTWKVAFEAALICFLSISHADSVSLACTIASILQFIRYRVLNLGTLLFEDAYGLDACIIGEVERDTQLVTMRRVFGDARIVDMLVGEQLARMC